MAQDKRVFTGGMDKDSDPRLIKNGDYRDALNIRNISSSDSTSGSVENIEGNTIVPNQKFIDEETQVIEVTPIANGNSEFIELDSNQTFQSQKLIFSNKESAGVPYSLEIAYLDSIVGTNQGTSDFLNIGSVYNWTGNVDQKKTSQILYEMFGPGGPLSSLTIPDIITGNSITIQAELDFEENTALSGNDFTVTFKTTQAGSEFLIQAYGHQTGLDAGGEPFASSESDFAINDTEVLGVGIEVNYEVSFDSVVGVDTNVDDDDVVFGGATPIPVGATEYELSIQGSQPTDDSTEPDNNVNIFSWTQVGVGNSPDDYLVETFLDLDEIKNNFGSGGDFAFDANQDSFSQAFTDAISEDKFNHVLIDGGAGSTTTVGLIKTDFSSNTKLEGLNSGGARNNSGSVPYSQLEYYYNNTEVVEGDGFSISQGTLTFSGEDVLADNSYILKSPIIRNKSYKISFTVNGLEAIGKSFTLKSGNTDIGTSNSNGSNEFLFTPSGNSSVIYLSFDSNFSASDSFTITNLRLFLKDVPVSKLSIKLACLNTFKFNLAFATSESELRDSLSNGKYDIKKDSWYPGTSIELVNRSFGGGETGPTGIDLSGLQESLDVALGTIDELNLQITNLNSDHTAALVILNEQLATATANAAQIDLQLTAAQGANTALTTNLGQIYTSYTTLVNTTNDLTGGTINEETIAEVLAITQDSFTAEAFNAINSALTAYSDSVTSTNSELNQTIQNLEFQNNNLTGQLNHIALQLSDTNEAVVNISGAITKLQSDLDKANTRINELLDDIDAITPEDGVSQTDVDAVQALLDAVVPEDGITQANVDAIQSQLDDAIKAAEAAAEVAAAALQDAQDNSADEEEIERLEGLLTAANASVSVQQGLVNTAEDLYNAQLEANGTLAELNAELEAEVADLQLVVEEDGVSQADVDAAVAAANVISAQTIANLQENLDAAEENNGISEDALEDLELELISVKQQAAGALIAEAADIETIFLESQDTIRDLKINYNEQKIRLEEVKTESLSSDVSTRISQQIGTLNSQVDLIDAYNASKPTDIVSSFSDFSDASTTNLIASGNSSIDYSNPSGAGLNYTSVYDQIFFDNRNNSFLPLYSNKTVTVSIKFSNIVGSFLVQVFKTHSQAGTPYNLIDTTHIGGKYPSVDNTDTVTFSFNSGNNFQSIKITPVNWRDHSGVIESFSVSYVGELVPERSDIIDISTLFSSLATKNLDLSNEPLIDALDEYADEVTQLNENVATYTTTLGALYDNLSSLQTATQASINELGIVSSISQADIDAAVLNFNSEEFTLTQQIESLSDLVILLTQQIDSLEPRGNKWLFTLSGNAPVEKFVDFSNFKYSNLYLRITNSNTDYTPSIDALSGNLSGSINLNLTRPTTGYGPGREEARNGVGSNNFANSGSELVQFTRDLSRYEGQTIIDINFQNIASGDFMQSPISFKPSFIDSEGKTVKLDITLLNYDISNLIELDGDDYIATNRGDVNLTRETSYLTNEGINNGYQFTVQDINEVGGWEFSIVDDQGNSLKEFSNIDQESFNILVDGNEDYSWNFSPLNNSSYSTSANYQLHFEQIEVEDNSETENNNSAQSRSSSVESFVSRASLPSYSMASVKPSDALIYPSRSSDIILNKSRDRAPNLSDYNLGAKKYIKNTLLQKTIVKSNLSSKYSCIGTYEDKPKNSIYYLVHDNSSNHYDCILEYSLIDDKVRTVYQDGRVGSDGLTENILNFSNDKAITGVNKIDDIFYWTDDLNRPRKINVELAKKNEVNIDNAVKFEEIYYNGNYSSAFISYDDNSLKNDFRIGDVIYTQAISGGPKSYNGYAKVTGIVRKMAPSVKFSTTNNSNEVTSNSDLSNVLDPGEFIGIMFENFPYYYQVESISGNTITTVQPVIFTISNTSPLSLPNGNNAGALLTDCPFLESFTQLPGILMFADPSDAYSPLISFGGYDDKMRYLDVIKHQPYNRPSITPETDSSYKHNNILDNLFQFKYRYVHHDNENTSYSGISDVIIDDEFARNTPLKFSEYSKTANNLKVGYVDAISDVKKIEIVARKGNDGEFFLVETVQNNFIKYLKVLKNELIIDSEFYFDVTSSKINFKNNGVYPFVDKAESDKLFDAVPKLAKAQTIISDNRLTYGNILEGYDNTPLVMKSSFESDGKPKIETTESSLLVFATTDTSKPVTTFSETNADNAQNSNIVSGVDWDVFDNSNCQLDLFVELNGLDLNDVNSQILSLNLTFGLKRDKAGGKTLQRSGKLNMNIDITGLTTINQVRNELIGQITQGNYQGGLDADNYNADNVNDNDGTIQVTTSGATRVRIRFRFIDNDETGESNGIGTLIWGTHEGWRNVKATIDTKLLSGAPGISSFKTGAFHDFGIAYFDETNRCSFVNTSPDFGNVPLQDEFEDEEVSVNLNGTRLYNKFPTEIGPELGQSSGVKFEIYNRPPKWATSYQFVYAGNTSVDEFMQVTIPHVIPGSGGGDTQMYLSLQSLKSHKSSYTESTSSLVDFDVADGDRIRFISCKIGNERKRFTTYLDFEITGFDLYSEEDQGVDGNPIDVPSGAGGFYITIPNPGSQTVELDDGNTVSLNHSGFSLDGSGYDLLIAEIYRPRKTQSPENLVYNEIGDRYAIGNAGTSQRYHDGDTAQNPDYFISKEVNTEVSLVPAVIIIDSGDVYMKARTMFTIKDGSTFESFACEDYFLNDFHHTNHYDKGRINVINTNAAERRLDTSVYYSETYSSTGSINGLSSFNLANVPYFDYNKEFGSIQSLKNSDNDLIIFHESKVGRVLVKSDILNTASGTGLVSLSNEVISNYANLYSGQFGCGLNPESIVRHGKKFYFTDIKRGAVLRLSTDGLTVISDYGMKDYFRDIGEMYIKYNPDKIKTFEDSDINNDGSPYLLIGGYDPKYDEYVLTIPTIESPRGAYNSGNSSNANKWSESISDWDNVTSLVNLSSDETIFNAVTLAFSEGTNRWTSFYSFIPEFYSKINKQFVSFKQGRIYRHNDSDVYSRGNSDFNKFYGHNNLSYIDFVFNAEPSSVKTYNAIGLESDTKFITGMFTNMGQYYGNYSDVITTSISFKKVDGTVTNFEGNNEIIGNNTEFYESVSPGDLVRVFGIDKGGYLSKDFIVSKVISNNLITVNEPLKMHFKDSYMLVIDYKSKEGIQYSDIPFAGSSYDSTLDENQFGDGSEIQGVGSVKSFSDSSYNNYSVLSGPNLNVVDFNKPIDSVDMISGAQYALFSISSNSNFSVSYSDYNLQASDTYQGSVFTSNFPQTPTGDVKVISTNYKLYLKQSSNNETVFLGYIFDSRPDKLSFLKSPNYNDVDPTKGFLFVVKSGSVEGERMKGSYMRTILATNLNQSKSKFNLYAANADIDKSELSNR